MPDNSRSYLLPNPYFGECCLNSSLKLAFPSLQSRCGFLPLGKDSLQEAVWRTRLCLTDVISEPSRPALTKRLLCPDCISPFLRQKDLTHWDRSIPNRVAGSSQGVSPLPPPSWTRRRLKFGRKQRAPTHPSPKGSVLIKVWFCMYLGRKRKGEKVMISSTKGFFVLMTRGVKRR